MSTWLITFHFTCYLFYIVDWNFLHSIFLCWHNWYVGHCVVCAAPLVRFLNGCTAFVVGSTWLLADCSILSIGIFYIASSCVDIWNENNLQEAKLNQQQVVKKSAAAQTWGTNWYVGHCVVCAAPLVRFLNGWAWGTRYMSTWLITFHFTCYLFYIVDWNFLHSIFYAM
jgi:hypothetical protein